jgi:hypothetical protein
MSDTGRFRAAQPVDGDQRMESLQIIQKKTRQIAPTSVSMQSDVVSIISSKPKDTAERTLSKVTT